VSRLLASIARRRPTLLAGDEPLDIDRLISPLRYDVLVRERYLRFLEVNRNLYDGDFDAYVELARGEPYYAWFCAVAIHRIRPGKDNRGAELEVAFRERLRKTTALADAITARGFDPQYPIIVRTAGPVAVTDTGKSVAGRLFPSDGCHRLALLRLAGHRQLPPALYRIRSEAGWQPPDNTGTLITALGLTPAEYFEFLSLGYSSGLHRDADALLADVPAPADAAELRRIIAVDSSRLKSAMDA
jgi:hypothetical protein